MYGEVDSPFTLNWSQVRVKGESTSPYTRKSQVARSTLGTEP